MSVKTVRFNSKEEKMLKSLLDYYGEDFSTCMKKLVAEKVEDLLDIRAIRKIKEAILPKYVSAARIDAAIAKNR